MAGIHSNNMRHTGLPDKQGLYDPAYEHDSCGVGFVVHIKGEKSYDIVKKGVTVLKNLSHRGAQGADPKTGDGAGILIQLPDAFFRSELFKKNISLPGFSQYAAGMIFFPEQEKERLACFDIFQKFAEKEGLEILAWRDVPVDYTTIGRTAQEVAPVIKQIFLRKPQWIKDILEFERKLYILRRLIEKEISSSAILHKKSFYISSLSSRTIIYKGLLRTEQLESFYHDLRDERLISSLALVHSRYSTNTFPTWDLSQPFRFLAHNGEINTLRGNINWMRARQASLASPFFGKEMEKLFPVIVPGGSDSATLDNVVEFLLLSGRSLPHVMMMLIPEAWENNTLMEEEKRRFYE